MPTLLHLDSSADLDRSRSRALTAAFAEAWLNAGSNAGSENRVIRRDLHRDQLPHLADPEQHWASGLRRDDAAVPAEADRIQQQVLAELFAADALVIGVPTYNYSMPSTLKAWLDCIHVPGVTVGADPVAQPLAGRPVVLISTSGATYDPGTPTEAWNHAVPPLQIVLGDSLGMDVHLISATRTLADRVPEMAAERERADAEFAAARQKAVALAQELVRRVPGRPAGQTDGATVGPS